MGHENMEYWSYPQTVSVSFLSLSLIHSLCASHSLFPHIWTPLGGGWSRSWLHPPPINIHHSQRGWLVPSWCLYVIIMHERLRHLSKADVTHLSRSRYIPKLSFFDHQFCKRCQYGKQAAASYPIIALTESSPLNLVHLEVYDPIPHQSLGGSFYFVSFIDDSTKKVWSYLAKTKDQVFSRMACNSRELVWSNTKMPSNQLWRRVFKS